MNSHRYSVQFRISGDIVPDEVTLRLGLQPNEIRIAGTMVHGRAQKESLWSYSGAPEGIFVQEWPRLEDGLLRILDDLLPKREAIQHYIDNYSTIWWCGHFQSSFDGGPTLSPSLLSRLADFGVPIFIDNYFSSD
jgi:Domain of unknown function (DUF4279)